MEAKTSSNPQAMATKELNAALYICTQQCAAALYTTYFRWVHAPTGYTFLGQEIDRLSRALEHLSTEIQNPDSKVVRSDNSRAAAECLGLALDGVHASLIEVERMLTALHDAPHNTEHGLEFAVKTQFSGGEKKLQELQERVGYHCWAFDLVMRMLMGNDAIALWNSIETMDVTGQLRRMLSEQADEKEKTPIVGRFEKLCIYDEKNLFTDFPVAIAIRVAMFWTFEAISKLGHVAETKHVSPSGYLDLLKAAWLLQELRESQSLGLSSDEARAVVALVSTELLFTFSTLVKASCFPDREAIETHGDFRIILEHLVEDNNMPAPFTGGSLQTVWEHGILNTTATVPPNSCKRVGSTNPNAAPTQGPEVSTAHSTPSLPPPPYTAVAADGLPGPGGLPFTPPCIPQRGCSNRTRRPPINNLRVETHRDYHHEAVLVEQPKEANVSKPPSPLSPILSLEDILPYCNAEPEMSEASDGSGFMSPSPTTSEIIDEIYCDSPTLGLEECFNEPVRIGPLTPEPVFTPATLQRNEAPTLLELPPRQPTVSRSSSGSSSSSYVMANPSPTLLEEKELPPLPPLLAPELSRRASVLQIYDSRAPSLDGPPGEEDSWNVDFAVEYGVRPGEREIMPESFAQMKLKTSEACRGQTVWEECIIRVFETQITGEYRLLTLRGKNVDQRYLRPSATEFVPEYGYHESLPVVFLRKAGPGTYSSNLHSKDRGSITRRKSSVSSFSGTGQAGPPPLATLCYKFYNLVDMFAFQQAFLQESVEADVQNIRSIRYTRGFLSGEHTTHKARIQLWKPAGTELSGGLSSYRNSIVLSQAPSLRSAAPPDEVRVNATRLVMYLDEIIISIFVTDDIMIAIPNNSPRTLRIRPSSHKAFGNPSSVKACVLGDPKRDLSGGFRLDKEGMGIEKQEAFDDFKWFEIEFQTDAECRCFAEEFTAALQQRRRERLMVEELKKKASRGIKMGEVFY